MVQVQKLSIAHPSGEILNYLSAATESNNESEKRERLVRSMTKGNWREMLYVQQVLTILYRKCYHIKWDKTSWTYSKMQIKVFLTAIQDDSQKQLQNYCVLIFCR